MNKIEKFKKIIFESNNIVFFGGAGVSTESNISDFRSKEGLYQQQKYKYNAETILSHDFFYSNNDYFYLYYSENMLNLTAKPNRAHIALKKLEDSNKLKAIITQNIDGLHQMAGSKNVIELHGSVHRNYCTKCHNFMSAEEMVKNKFLCNKCKGLMKPDVVLYQESLPMNEINKAIYYISNAEVLIVGGTSLMVYPAAGLIQYFKGKHLILINKEKTSYDELAEIVFNISIGDILSEIA